jgi:hypothetical protein
VKVGSWPALRYLHCADKSDLCHIDAAASRP